MMIMVRTIDLSSFRCLGEPSRLRKLNRSVAIHTDLMPHVLATATGCELEEAIELLTLLYHQGLGALYLLVYHTAHQNIPVRAQGIAEGPPPLPFICPVCEEEVHDPNELFYDFLFKVDDEIEFVVRRDDPN